MAEDFGIVSQVTNYITSFWTAQEKELENAANKTKKETEAKAPEESKTHLATSAEEIRDQILAKQVFVIREKQNAEEKPLDGSLSALRYQIYDLEQKIRGLNAQALNDVKTEKDSQLKKLKDLKKEETQEAEAARKEAQRLGFFTHAMNNSKYASNAATAVALMSTQPVIGAGILALNIADCANEMSGRQIEAYIANALSGSDFASYQEYRTSLENAFWYSSTASSFVLQAFQMYSGQLSATQELLQTATLTIMGLGQTAVNYQKRQIDSNLMKKQNELNIVQDQVDQSGEDLQNLAERLDKVLRQLLEQLDEEKKRAEMILS